MFALKVAIRFLTSNKTQTILISLGIAIGVSVQLFIGSLITGLQANLIDTTVGSSSHITISNMTSGETISDWQSIKIDSFQYEHISYVLDRGAFIIKDIDTSYSMLVRGFDIEKADKIYKISDNLVEGKMPTNVNEVLLSNDKMAEIGLKLNDEITILTPDGKQSSVKVVGIYDLKVAAINKSWMITNLDTAQSIFSLGDVITSIEMQVSDVFAADTIAKNIGLSIDDSLKVSNWKDDNAQLLAGLNGQSISSLMIQIFVVISVVLAIASVLIISVVQKRRQIGILKAMGITDSTASRIFLFQGAMLGILGATLGIMIGCGLLYSFTKFALNPDGTPVVPIVLSFNLIAVSWSIAFVAAILASIIPSLSSKKLSPMEVIKNG